MRYLLDTNAISKIYDKNAKEHTKILHRLAALADSDEVAISTLAIYELEYGWSNAPDSIKEVVRQKVSQAQEDFAVVPIPLAGAPIFGHLKSRLRERRGVPQKTLQKHSVDLILAATCLVDQRTLVSSDTIFSELQNLEPALAIEDWAK